MAHDVSPQADQAAAKAAAFQVSPDILFALPRNGVDGRVYLVGDDSSITLTGDYLSVISKLAQHGPFTVEQACEIISGLALQDAPQLVLTDLLVAGIVAPCESGASGARTDAEVSYPWDDCGWVFAKLFHASTVFTRFVTGDPAGDHLTEVMSADTAALNNEPPLIRDVGGERSIALPIPAKSQLCDVSFFDVLLSRRTTRTFPQRVALDTQALSILLFCAAKAHAELRNPYFGRHMLRTSPSGGARHPVEIYPQVLISPDVATGGYYYNPLDHTLRYMKHADDALIHKMGRLQRGTTGMSAAFLITARFARNMWKYRYSKSYLFTMLDVGHFVQTLILCCEALGLRCFLTPALDVAMAQQHLDLPNVYDECPVYLVCAG